MGRVAKGEGDTDYDWGLGIQRGKAPHVWVILLQYDRDHWPGVAKIGQTV